MGTNYLHEDFQEEYNFMVEHRKGDVEPYQIYEGFLQKKGPAAIDYNKVLIDAESSVLNSPDQIEVALSRMTMVLLKLNSTLESIIKANSQ